MVISPTPTHPQDHGNRKRVFEICSRLKNMGAKIHFAHYASEHDWRDARPAYAEAQMRATWDGYDLIAPSRPLHMGAIERDHSIDEWEDPALSVYVNWVCGVQRFDAVIVNYTWLSFCLNSVPDGVFKILDTHDAFGKRRTMLEQMGIGPEFFHTTPEEEAKGLARADLVWAIKEDEREYFTRELGVKNCLTMLHAEPGNSVWREQISDDGFLRAGVIGARNNVNRRNLEEFLSVALPQFSHYLADVKIVIAGGCADDFLDFQHPNVEIVGRVPHVEDFYRHVDVVIAPIAVSTGLKIKVAEAMGSGAPLVALAHATEGFPTQEPRHLLRDFKEMAMELIKLAFDRDQLPGLAEGSRQICTAIDNHVQAAMAETYAQLIAREASHMCVVVPMAALDPSSLLHDHLWTAINFMRHNRKIALYLTGPAAPPKFDLFKEFGREMRVFAEPAVLNAMADTAPASWSAIDLSDLFSVRGYEHAYFMTDCHRALGLHTGRLKRAFVRHDAVTLAGGDVRALLEFLRPVVPCVVIGAYAPSLALWNEKFGIAVIATVPFRQNGDYISLPEVKSGAPSILILASAQDPLIPALRYYAEELGATISLLDPRDPAVRAALAYPGKGRDAAARQRALIGGAKLLIELSPSNEISTILREAVQRLGIPVISPLRGAQAGTMGLNTINTSPASLLPLLRMIGLALADGNYAAWLGELTKATTVAETADAGWYFLWQVLAGTPLENREWENVLGVK